MRGLVAKDLQILLMQKKVIFIIAAVSAIIGMGKENQMSFLISYTTIIFVMLALGTISYDKLDNGFAFMFTLPITRKEYVKEKYILTTVICLLAWAYGYALGMGIMLVKGETCNFVTETLGSALMMMVFLIVGYVMLPIQIKYDAEKAKIFMFGIAGGVIVLGMMVGFIFTKFVSVRNYFSEVVNYFSKFSENELLLILLIFVFLVVCITMVITYCISAKILKNKQL